MSDAEPRVLGPRALIDRSGPCILILLCGRSETSYYFFMRSAAKALYSSSVVQSHFSFWKVVN